MANPPINKLGDAISLDRQGRLAEARPVYEKAVETTEGAEQDKATLLLGRCLIELGEVQLGCERLKGLVSHPKFGEAANVFLGLAFINAERWEDAELALRNALAMRASPEGWCLLHAVLFRGSTRDQESLECLHRALELDPDYAEAHANLAMRMRLDGMLVDAEAHARRAIELDPEYGFALAELAALLLPLRDDVSIRQAVTFARKAVEYEPTHLWGWLYLAIAAWKVGALDEAEHAYSQACELTPAFDLPWALFSDFVLKVRSDTGRAKRIAELGIGASAHPGSQQLLAAWMDAAIENLPT